ncbi:MAG TPA: class I SAM-dependent methyltransferase [Nitrospinota bacterium]|nr:class I SAM-dependent methyltransferase [Nitrospinota bacterium]|tara:strand:+ start:3813 stop:5159 length:1347 start_codon:yes stop_codon:yes gene_type:complete
MANFNNNDEGLVLKTGDDIDPSELSKRIKEQVRIKMRDGFYDIDEVDRVANTKTKTSLPAEPQVEKDKKVAMMERLSSNWSRHQDPDFITHRSGFQGKLIPILKKTLFRLSRRAYYVLWGQEKYNNYVMDAIGYLLADTSYYRARYLSTANRVEDLDQRISKLENNLADSVEKLSNSLANLDKQGIFLKRRVSDALKVLSDMEGSNVSQVAQEERAKLDSFDYRLFENIHRGSRLEIKNRMGLYLKWFNNSQNVLDVGCGRGELLEVFSDNGISATGIDINEEMTRECNERGQEAVEADAMEYMENIDNDSLGGITAIQFIEHLPVEVMTRFFELAYDKLKPGAHIVAETINAACLATFCGAFYLDLSHYKPLHPLAVHFLLERIGYSSVQIEYVNPFPKPSRLAQIPDSLAQDSNLPKRVVKDYNENVMKLNNILFSNADYAVIACK